MSKRRLGVVIGSFALAGMFAAAAILLAMPASAAEPSTTGVTVLAGNGDKCPDGQHNDGHGCKSPTPTPTHTRTASPTPTHSKSMSPSPSHTPSKSPSATPSHTTTPSTTTTPAPIQTTAGPAAVAGGDGVLQTVRSPWFWVLTALAGAIVVFFGRRRFLRARRGTAPR